MLTTNYTIKTAFQDDRLIEELAVAMQEAVDSPILGGSGCYFEAAPEVAPTWRWVTFHRNLGEDSPLLLERIQASNFNLSAEQAAVEQLLAELCEYLRTYTAVGDDPLVSKLLLALSPKWGKAEVTFPPDTRENKHG